MLHDLTYICMESKIVKHVEAENTMATGEERKGEVLVKGYSVSSAK